MKSILKSAIFGVLSAAILTTSAYAGVECKVHNAKGKVWMGSAETRHHASAKALKACARHSKHAQNCVVEYCRTHEVREHEHKTVHEKEHVTHVRHHFEGESWKCTTTNANSNRYEARGMTREHAVEKAMHHCAINSGFDSHCALLGCFERIERE